MKIPQNKGALSQAILKALRAEFDDPVVEITEIKANMISVRVGQGERGPRRFRIQVVEEV